MLLLLIDALNLIRRVYAAVPGNVDDPSHFDAALTAITRSVGRALEQHEPTHVACVMDPVGSTWRHAVYADYKKGRTPMPDALQNGMSRVTEAIEGLGVTCFAVDGFEADDVVATLAVRTATRGGHVVILSTDSKFAQLLRPGIVVYDHFRRGQLDTDFCRQRFGVEPMHLRDWFALVGDGSLNLPGVAGVGAKTATNLLNEFKSLAEIFRRTDEIKGHVRDKLIAGRAAAELAYELVGFPDDVDVGINLKQLRYRSATPNTDQP